jgi:hypothetical protein
VNIVFIHFFVIKLQNLPFMYGEYRYDFSRFSYIFNLLRSRAEKVTQGK